jgi:hypothetical protein
VLVYPSVLKAGVTAAYGIVDLGVTVGFGALFGLSYLLLVPRLGLQSSLD